MKLEVENSATHLDAMRKTIQRLRTLIAGYNLAHPGHMTVFSSYELHLGQTEILLHTLANQAEAAEAAKAKRKS